ncbi:MAG: glycosyltransferase XagB, partial [Alphaproteobacteria bacterium]|nr:glycosyltransferase XagB [Alphaproteobacteria bacterium]
MAFEDGDGPVMDRFETAAPFAAERIAPVPSVASLLDRIRRSPARPKSACPEIDCVRDRLPLDVLAAVERRAAEVGVGADRVLIAAGICDEDSYMMALAASLGLAFETFDHHGRASCPLDPGRLVEAVKTGLLPLMVGGKLAVVVAPRSVRQFVDYVARNPQVTFRLTSTRRLNRFVFGDYERALGHMASEALVETAPHLSAATRSTTPWIIGGVIASIFFGGFIVSPGATMELFGTILAVCFLLWLLLRVLSSCIGSPPTRTIAIPDRQLPVYTVIAALYREADSVEDLIGSLAALDYPPEKLDIKLVLERHDLETWTAIKRLNPGAPFEIIMAPDHGPRTKPKALNAALPFARGTFTVIYDAEDRPEPDQLRIALGRFRAEDARVACVQASLTIDNTADSWLSRMFTAEYAAQFDLFLPGLALMKLPLPLGGSSNHFRTSVLREVGAWDSYNVTEDADLGMRLARLGYRST